MTVVSVVYKVKEMFADDVNEAEMLAVDNVIKSADVDIKLSENVSSQLPADDNDRVESDALTADHMAPDPAPEHDPDHDHDPDHPDHGHDHDRDHDRDDTDGDDRAEAEVKKSKKSRLSTLVTGWRTYARQSVVFAGVSLALLYMTVLGFDSITVGSSLSLCISVIFTGIY